MFLGLTIRIPPLRTYLIGRLGVGADGVCAFCRDFIGTANVTATISSDVQEAIQSLSEEQQRMIISLAIAEDPTEDQMDLLFPDNTRYISHIFSLLSLPLWY